MRLAIDLRSLQGGEKISGVENYVLNLVNRIVSSPAIDPVFFYNSFRRPVFPKELQLRHGAATGIKSTRVPNKIFNLLLGANLFRLENLYGSFDALWLPDLRPFAIRPKTKLILSVHDLSPVLHPEFYSRRRRIWHWLLNYKKSFARADLIFAVSEYTKYDLVKIFGLDPNKIEVVYPGVDHKEFHLNLDQRLKHKVREKYNLPEKYILAVSTIEPRKNLAGLIEAFERIDDPELHLVFAGRLGWLYQDFLDRLAVSPKKAKIKLLGYVEQQDKPFLISQAEMLCYPSFYEGFGFQPLEAMACGVPVITSARTAMPEVSGAAALLVEPNHLEDLAAAIRALLADRELRAELVRKGLAQSAKFSWEQSAGKIIAALGKL